MGVSEKTGFITVPLTDKECKVLAELSKTLDLPQDRVMVQALRWYQLALNPIEDLPKGLPALDR